VIGQFVSFSRLITGTPPRLSMDWGNERLVQCVSMFSILDSIRFELTWLLKMRITAHCSWVRAPGDAQARAVP
jgi:hypothetical protein